MINNNEQEYWRQDDGWRRRRRKKKRKRMKKRRKKKRQSFAMIVPFYRHVRWEGGRIMNSNYKLDRKLLLFLALIHNLESNLQWIDFCLAWIPATKNQCVGHLHVSKMTYMRKNFSRICSPKIDFEFILFVNKLLTLPIGKEYILLLIKTRSKQSSCRTLIGLTNRKVDKWRWGLGRGRLVVFYLLFWLLLVVSVIKILSLVKFISGRLFTCLSKTCSAWMHRKKVAENHHF